MYKGCFVCISHGEDKCPLQDDRDLIIDKIESSDGVILASPNYVMNVPWLTKIFIDRFAYTMHRPKFFNQKFMILITSGSYMGTKQASKTLGLMASGGEIITKLKVLYSPGMNEKKTLKQEKAIEKTARIFYKRLSKRSDHRPSFGFLIWFSVFKATSNESKTHLPADYNFYKDKNYFTNTKLSFVQRRLVGIFTALFTKLVRLGFV